MTDTKAAAVSSFSDSQEGSEGGIGGQSRIAESPCCEHTRAASGFEVVYLIV